MGTRDAAARAAAIDGFAAILGDLRTDAGNPSFREMSGRSQAISHTTLHEAVHGHRLPSWPTTVEFVKACRAEPADYRARWELARAAVRAAGCETAAADVEDVPVAEPVDAPPANVGPESAIDSGHEVPPVRGQDSAPQQRSRYLVLAAGIVMLLGAGVAFTVANGDTSSAPEPSATQSAAAHVLAGKDCPMHPTTPPYAPPRHRGDAGVFVADVNLPDCVHVQRGMVKDKIWRLKNVGTVTWRGYMLHRLDEQQGRNDCQTISDVRIPVTVPGRTVDIRVRVSAPDNPEFCYVRFKMQDAAGHDAFPSGRPLNFQLIID